MVMRVSLEQAEQALSRIKGKFETGEFDVTIVSPDRYSEVLDFFEQYFIPDEVLSKGHDFKRTDFSDKRIKTFLKHNISVIMFDKSTKQIVGIRLSRINRKDDVVKIGEIPLPQRDIIKFLTQRDDDIDFYSRYDVDEAYAVVILAISREYRGRGLATTLMELCLGLAKNLQFEVVRGEGTSNASQKVFEKCGFETLAVLPYDEYIYKGKPFSMRTGDNKTTKVYARRV